MGQFVCLRCLLVCCVFGFKMMILGPIVGFIDVNGVFKLLEVTLQWGPLITWVCVDLQLLEHVYLHPRGGASST
jgi:hypothetical protein